MFPNRSSTLSFPYSLKNFIFKLQKEFFTNVAINPFNVQITKNKLRCQVYIGGINNKIFNLF